MSFYPYLNTCKIIMMNITWYLDCRGGEIMVIELTMWHTISARNQEVVRKSSFVVVSAVSSNLSLLFFWTSVWQCGLMSERKGLWPWTIWVQILTLPLTLVLANHLPIILKIIILEYPSLTVIVRNKIVYVYEMLQ